MALSMDEQRILAEIEERLERAEPGLAARLSSFGSPAAAPRPVRGLILASLVAVLLMAVVSVTLSALSPLRAVPVRGVNGHPASRSANPMMTAAGATGTVPSAGTGAAPSAGTGAAPSAGTGAVPSAGTGAAPSAGPVAPVRRASFPVPAP